MKRLLSGIRQMSLTRIAIAVAVTTVAAPALAADIAEPVPVSPWEIYVGAHGGGVWGNGRWKDAVDNKVDLDGSRGIFGALAGVNYRLDTVFLGLEGDIGFATGKFKWEGKDEGFGENLDGCANGTWCDWNSHIRLRVGAGIFDGLDLFVAGGIALADGNADDKDSLLGQAKNDTFEGWSLGVGADYAVTDHFKLRVEYLHDDYGDHRPVPHDSNYNSDWADDTVRGAVIFVF